ncbi:hypothetical protein SH139x_002880 [Planctomycetaceae bacterium SH139]
MRSTNPTWPDVNDAATVVPTITPTICHIGLTDRRDAKERFSQHNSRTGNRSLARGG